MLNQCPYRHVNYYPKYKFYQTVRRSIMKSKKFTNCSAWHVRIYDDRALEIYVYIIICLYRNGPYRNVNLRYGMDIYVTVGTLTDQCFITLTVNLKKAKFKKGALNLRSLPSGPSSRFDLAPSRFIISPSLENINLVASPFKNSFYPPMHTCIVLINSLFLIIYGYCLLLFPDNESSEEKLHRWVLKNLNQSH